MNTLPYVLTMLLALVLCIANVYSMHTFRISTKKLILTFSAVTLICIAGNACLIFFSGREVFQNLMLATTAVPYFLLFLIVAKERISQIFFNFWFWVRIRSNNTNGFTINYLTCRV